MAKPLPLFSSSASLKDGSIFAIDKPGAAVKAGRKHGPVSLIDLAKEEKLKKVYLVDDRWVSFMMADKYLREIGSQLCFGLKLVVCADMADKSEASLKTESKVVIWMTGDGSADYHALINLYTKAAQDGFYYVPRLDWKTLNAGWHKDLMLSLPFYSSFLAKNTLTFASIVPEMPTIPLVLREVGQQLPFDDLLNTAVDRYVAASGAGVREVKSVYYKDRKDARDFMVWRCILGRTTWDKPNFDGMHSREFSWQSYKELSS